MKNRNFVKNSIFFLLPAAMAVGSLLGVYKKRAEKVGAYDKDGILPTTILLNDNSEQEIKNYYSNLSSLSSDELQGQNLLKNLKPILKNGQKYYKYDSDSLWAMYEITDRDWEKSPANQIPSGYGSYNAQTNTITGYKYGSSTSSNKGSNPYIHALYVDRSIDNLTTAWDDHSNSQWGINQEHIWPKSQGFNEIGQGGARGDPMHLWAGNSRVNQTEHNNHMYGFVDINDEDTINPYSEKGYKSLKDNYLGKSLTISTSTDTVFEPQDSDKGDIARAIFYMVARYNNVAGNDTTIDQNNPNLALKQTTTELASYTTTTANRKTGYMGLMTDLLYWNHLDPVDEYEIHRNNLLFNNFTHNRNPFIDYPEWADYIWGKPVYNGRSYVSYISTPTGSVNLSTDVINGFKDVDPSIVTVKSLEVVSKPNKLVYNAGETLNTTGLSVRAVLSNNTIKVLNSNEYTVSPSGALKASDTKATITYQGVTAEFDIAVKGGISEGDSVTILAETYGAPSFTTNDGDYSLVSSKTDSGSASPAYNETGKDIRIYAKGTLEIEAKSSNFKKIVFNISTQGKKRLAEITPSIGSVTYDTENGLVEWTGNSNKVIFTVGDKAVYGTDGATSAGQLCFTGLTITLPDTAIPVIDVDSISLNKNSTTLEIGASEKLEATVLPNNATVKLVSWESSNTSIVAVSDDGEITAKSQGNATITCKSIDDSTKTATCNVTVSAPVVLQSITLSGNYPTNFLVGNQFSNEGMVVTANYSDGSHDDVTDSVEISGYDMNSIGTQTVTVLYDDISTTYSITIGASENSINTFKNTGNSSLALSSGTKQEDFLAMIETEGYSIITGFKNASNSYIGANGGSGDGAWNIWDSLKIGKNGAAGSITLLLNNSIDFGSIKIKALSFRDDGALTVNGITTNVTKKVTKTDVQPIELVYDITGPLSELTLSSKTGTSNYAIVITSIEFCEEEVEPVEKELDNISISGQYKTVFNIGETFSFGGTVIATYSDESTEDVTEDVEFSGYDLSTAGNQTVTITFENKTITYSITVASSDTKSYTISGGEFLEGEYLIGSMVNETTYNFMKAEIVNSRFAYSPVSVANNQCSTSNASLVWKIEKSGEYYTIFNEEANKYAASTGAANKGALQDSVDDKALWSLETLATEDGYCFVNKQNTTKGVNASLKNNGTYGFATYSSSSAYPNLSLFRLDNTSFIKMNDILEINDGSFITIASIKNNITYGLGEITNNQVIPTVDLELSVSGLYTYSDNQLICFEVEKVGNNFALKYKDKYLSSQNSSSNVFLSSEITNSELFEITYSNSKCSIKCIGNSRYLRMNYNGGNSRFGFYSSNTSYEDISLYIDRNSSEASVWAKTFINSTNGCKTSSWDTLSNLFNKLSYVSRSTISSAIADQNGSLIEQAAARYDYMIGDARYDVNAFITNRGVSPMNKNLSFTLFEEENTQTILIVVFGAIGLTSIGAYIFVKRRKETEING